MEHNGFHFDDEKINDAFLDFKKLTDTKKYVTVDDITSLLTNGEIEKENYKFISYHSATLEDEVTQVSVILQKDGQIIQQTAVGNGQVDAAYRAINKIVNEPIEIINYEINAISSQSDALGEARVRLKLDNREINTSGLDVDIIKASILAYIQGINKLGLEF